MEEKSTLSSKEVCIYFLQKGDHKVKSEQKLEMTKDNKLNFNKEILEMEATLYFDEKENKYQ